MSQAVVVETPNFRLRELTVEDATPRYAAWLRDAQIQRWISGAAATQELSALRAYIASRVGRDDVLFLGIFAKDSGLHVGNIKYEPIDSVAGKATLGVMVGDPDYRGRGVFREVLEGTLPLLRARKVRQVELGVSRENEAAVRAYRAAGFVETPHPQLPESVLWMVRRV